MAPAARIPYEGNINSEATYPPLCCAQHSAGYGKLYDPARKPGAVTEALCWAHSRRKLFELADIAASARRRSHGKAAAAISPLAFEGVRRIDAIFAIECHISGQSAEARLAVRQQLSKPRVDDLHAWMTENRAKLASHNPVAKAMDYMLKRWPGFTRFLDDGRIDLSNNAAERALRGIALGRKSWLFAGSDRGGQRAAIIYSLIGTAKLNDVDPQAWLADVLARIADHPVNKIDDLLPWNWKRARLAAEKAA
jgi:transposase